MLFNLNYIDPTAFSIGPLSIKWYGIIIAVGILIGYFIAQESLKYVGLHKDTLVDVIFYSAIFGFITARIYFVIFQWPYYAQNPFEIPMIWHGGIAIHGGLLGGFITGIIVCKIKNLNPFQIGDIVAPSIILAQGIGRWGNFMNHEAHGGPVSRTFLENLHIPGRFFVEGLRTDSLMLTSHIRVAQLVSVILIIIGLVILIYRRIKYQPPLYKEAGPLTWNSSKAKVKS